MANPLPLPSKANDNIFLSPYLAADAPEVLFLRIEDCTKVALLGKNPYTDRQLIYTAIRLLLNTGLYVRAFEGCDLLAEVDQTWSELRHIVQEVFQWRLNATASTADHQDICPCTLLHDEQHLHCVGANCWG